MGFEPTIGVTSYDDLANHSFQPAHASFHIFLKHLYMKKRKVEIHVKCDYCGKYTTSFVVTTEHKRFCRWQTPGFPPDEDCLEDYIQSKRTPISGNITSQLPTKKQINSKI